MYKNVDLSYILNNFNIENFNLEKIKEKTTKKNRIIYKVNYYDNVFCLKQTYFKKHELLFMYSYLQWLNFYEFKTPYLIKTKQNEPFLEYNSKIFILMNWINGEKLNYDNLDECIKSITFLAKLHKYSNNIPLIHGSNDINKFLNLDKKYTKNIYDLHKMHKIAKNLNDNFSNIFLKHFYILEYMSNISKKFSQIINFNKLNKSVCHGDFVNKNILIDNKKITPIDFDRCCINYSISDLSYFLRRYLRRSTTNWNFKLTKILLKYYDRINPLILDEYLYLFSYLTFPQKTFKISKFYFHNYQNLTIDQKIIYKKLLIKISSSFNNKLSFINYFKNYINLKFNLKK